MTWCPRVDRPLELLFDLWIVDRPVEPGFALIAIADAETKQPAINAIDKIDLFIRFYPLIYTDDYRYLF